MGPYDHVEASYRLSAHHRLACLEDWSHESFGVWLDHCFPYVETINLFESAVILTKFRGYASLAG